LLFWNILVPADVLLVPQRFEDELGASDLIGETEVSDVPCIIIIFEMSF
jgi:hypothetical protein